MSIEDRPKNEQLVQAYNRMMERVKASLEKAEKAAAPRLRQAIDAAEEKAVELGELSREEAIKIADYLRRDLQEAGEYMAGPEGQELADWLRFDIELIEGRMLEMLLTVADQAKLDMLSFEEQLIEAANERHTGEITGPGTLVCQNCDEVLHFHKAGHIPPCPKCRGTVYQRSAAEE